MFIASSLDKLCSIGLLFCFWLLLWVFLLWFLSIEFCCFTCRQLVLFLSFLIIRQMSCNQIVQRNARRLNCMLQVRISQNTLCAIPQNTQPGLAPLFLLHNLNILSPFPKKNLWNMSHCISVCYLCLLRLYNHASLQLLLKSPAPLTKNATKNPFGAKVHCNCIVLVSLGFFLH